MNKNDQQKIINDIENLQAGVRLCYYTGHSGWLDSSVHLIDLLAYFRKLQKTGLYGFAQKRVTDNRFEGNVYEYYIWLLKHPETPDTREHKIKMRRHLKTQG